MKIEPFKVEEWMNAWETGARYNIAETCCDSVSIDELFALAGEDKEKFLNNFCGRRLTYGAIEGREDLPSRDIPSYRFCEEMYRKTGAFVTPGDCFEEPHSMRIGYACDTEVLKKGLAGVSEYLKEETSCRS